MSSAKDQPHHTWLHSELPGWVQAGLVSVEAAQLLRERHPAVPESEHQARSRHWAVVLFGILGAVLIGGGIILLLAHNWEWMSRQARAAVAFAPLVLSQGLAFAMLWSGRGGTSARETVGTFLALMAGACLALISQTYHLGGDFADFMLVWTLLSLPVAYLLRATLPAIWFCTATIWVCSAGGRETLWFWPLLALVLPCWWLESRHDRFHARAVFLGWSIVIAGTIGLGVHADHFGWPRVWMLAYAGWFALLFLAGRRWLAEGRTWRHRPLQVVGLLGAAAMALIFTFDFPWHDAFSAKLPNLSVAAWLALLTWPALALLLWMDALRRRALSGIIVGALPPLVALAWLVPPAGTGAVQVCFNGYVLASGVALLVLGVRQHQLGTVNGGMAILSALVMCRFFDSELSFVLRGLVFILLGVGFLATNLFLLRRKPIAP